MTCHSAMYAWRSSDSDCGTTAALGDIGTRLANCLFAQSHLACLRMNVRLATLISVATLLTCPRAAQAADSKSWLDRPLAGWNTPGAAVPKAPSGGESRDDILKRCRLTLQRSTPAERLLADAGWIPYLHFDRQLAQGDTEILDGMSGADSTCRPTWFHAFVFAGGRFAGTLSPGPMTTERDGSVAAIRIVSGDTITADFVRYRDEDPACCPSAHMAADRTAARRRTGGGTEDEVIGLRRLSDGRSAARCRSTALPTHGREAPRLLCSNWRRTLS